MIEKGQKALYMGIPCVVCNIHSIADDTYKYNIQIDKNQYIVDEDELVPLGDTVAHRYKKEMS